MRTRSALHLLLASGTVLSVLTVGPSAQAAPAGKTRFAEVDLVSDQPGRAPLVDPLLVNAWGLALGPTSPLWVADNGTDSATVYGGGVNGAPVAKVALEVGIQGGAPTGAAFNDTADFVVTGAGGSGPARFLFVGENGDLTAWSPAASRTSALVVAHVDGAVYKGLALLHTPAGPVLLAADFHNGRIDVFDGHFARVPSDALFHDRGLPRGYAPFNVFVSGDRVYVAYAKQDAEGTDEVAGHGLGFVDLFTDLGTRVHRIASHGTLNAPWGMAIAPASFGRFAGSLLVGNFGDGRINAFAGEDFLGQLRDADNRPLAIDGLWALLPGTATTGGTGVVWFSAGPDDEEHGLVGEVIPG